MSKLLEARRRAAEENRPVHVGGRTWAIPGPGVLRRVHTRAQCQDPNRCVIHHRTDHHMSEWPLVWHGGLFAMWQGFERICPHGIGHPDPDDALNSDVPHACDGCCRPPASGAGDDADQLSE